MKSIKIKVILLVLSFVRCFALAIGGASILSSRKAVKKRFYANHEFTM